MHNIIITAIVTIRRESQHHCMEVLRKKEKKRERIKNNKNKEERENQEEKIESVE